MNPFAFRVFGFEDTIPMPFSNVYDALRALFGNAVNKPESSAKIVAYYSNNHQLLIPRHLFTTTKQRLQSKLVVVLDRETPLEKIAEDIDAWLRKQIDVTPTITRWPKTVLLPFVKLWSALLHSKKEATSKLVVYRQMQSSQLTDLKPETIEDTIIRILIDPHYSPEPLGLALICKQRGNGSLIRAMCNITSIRIVAALIDSDIEDIGSIEKNMTIKVSQVAAVIEFSLIWSQLMLHFNNRMDLVESWLTREKRSLKGEKPISLMHSSFGRDAVFALLERLMFGDFS